MPVKEIIKVWDSGSIIKENVKFLMTPTKDVTFPMTNNVKTIINDLIDTYEKITCAGIAANQIGYNKNIFIGKKNEEDENDDFQVFINPIIDKVSEDSLLTGPEGCLSIPDLSLNIERYDKISVRWYDQKGRKKTDKISGFISRLFQHETEHLNGQLMIGGRIHSGRSQDSVVTALYYDLVKLLFGEVICPFYEQIDVVPFANQIKHRCKSKLLDGDCEKIVDNYCKNSARVYMTCNYFDKSLVL